MLYTCLCWFANTVLKWGEYVLYGFWLCCRCTIDCESVLLLLDLCLCLCMAQCALWNDPQIVFSYAEKETFRILAIVSSFYCALVWLLSSFNRNTNNNSNSYSSSWQQQQQKHRSWVVEAISIVVCCLFTVQSVILCERKRAQRFIANSPANR